MANPLLSLNENFSYNSMLARALLQLMPKKDKQAIQSWLYVLHEMNGTVDEMTIRNEYMWFLLIQLQNKRITEPFNHPPYSQSLLPLREILPPNIYEEVLMTTEKNISRLEEPYVENNEAKQEEEASKNKSFRAPPAKFLDNQPLPKNGIICYLAAFSDQS
ncbi:uncharacterized protein [Atheta coriaria]|uniref:uncharacterized protein n=1 Tax=Dalotia coriaria TaxID=877792 RepID=UPI0031F36E59